MNDVKIFRAGEIEIRNRPLHTLCDEPSEKEPKVQTGFPGRAYVVAFRLESRSNLIGHDLY